MSSFNHIGKYICECGKEFEKSNNFNAHKSHCKIHFEAKYENLDYYNQFHKERALKIKKTAVEKANIKKEQDLLIWIDEKHICEKCGKVMTEKFGSGRFCSRKCANSKNHSEETKRKISQKIKSMNIPKQYPKWLFGTKASEEKELKFCSLCGKQLSKGNKSGLCRVCIHTDEVGREFISSKVKE